MNRRHVAISCLAGSLILTAGCSSTHFIVKSAPPGAEARLFAQRKVLKGAATGLKDKVMTDTDYVVRNDDEYFGDQKAIQVGFEISKDGFRRVFRVENVRKGDRNDLKTVDLKPLSTEIVIEVDPPGTKAIFCGDGPEGAGRARLRCARVQIPMDESMAIDPPEESIEGFPGVDVDGKKLNVEQADSVITPWRKSYTEETAKNTLSKVKRIRIEADEFIPETKEIAIQPGQSNYYAFKLKKLSARLRVTSDLDGVEVDDVVVHEPGTSGGKQSTFGYLGKTPFARQFSAQECRRDEDSVRNQSLRLNLRCTKPGYVDRVYSGIEIPWGEDFPLNVVLRRQSTGITFQSDPPEVHVYVLRSKKDEIYNEETKQISTVTVDVPKHLGTTPFTWPMDPADPLVHNDVIRFRKPGYRDKDIRFAVGVDAYHVVMEPEVVKER